MNTYNFLYLKFLCVQILQTLETFKNRNVDFKVFTCKVEADSRERQCAEDVGTN